MSERDELVSFTMTTGELAALQRPLELDVQAWYAALRDGLIRELHDGARRGLSPEEIVKEIEELFGEGWFSKEDL